MRTMGGVAGWLWEALEDLMSEGQDWIVVVLVGELVLPFSVLSSTELTRGRAYCRHGHRTKRRSHLHLH